MISSNLSNTFFDTFSFPILYSSPKERKTIIRHPFPHSLTQNYSAHQISRTKLFCIFFSFSICFSLLRTSLILRILHAFLSHMKIRLAEENCFCFPGPIPLRSSTAAQVPWVTKLLDISLCIYCLYQRTEILLQSKVLSSLVSCLWKQSNEYNTQSWHLVSKFFNLKKPSQFLFCRAYINTSSQETKSSKYD